MKIEKKQNGLSFIEFLDVYDTPCILSTSSLASEPAIWLGPNKPRTKMLLTQEMVRDLLPHLTTFAMTGRLDEDEILSTS